MHAWTPVSENRSFGEYTGVEKSGDAKLRIYPNVQMTMMIVERYLLNTDLQSKPNVWSRRFKVFIQFWEVVENHMLNDPTSCKLSVDGGLLRQHSSTFRSIH